MPAIINPNTLLGLVPRKGGGGSGGGGGKGGGGGGGKGGGSSKGKSKSYPYSGSSGGGGGGGSNAMSGKKKWIVIGVIIGLGVLCAIYILCVYRSRLKWQNGSTRQGKKPSWIPRMLKKPFKGKKKGDEDGGEQQQQSDVVRKYQPGFDAAHPNRDVEKQDLESSSETTLRDAGGSFDKNAEQQKIDREQQKKADEEAKKIKLGQKAHPTMEENLASPHFQTTNTNNGNNTAPKKSMVEEAEEALAKENEKKAGNVS